MEENKGLIEIGHGETTEQLPIIADDRLIEIAEKAEKRIDAVNKIKRIALRVTNHDDWVDQQGKPYLEVSGAEKVGRVFGISWRIGEPVLFQEEDGHFNFTYSGTFTLGGATITAIGTRSSKDKFFSTRYKWNEDTKKKEPIELPASEIDKGDVKKGAYTNCIGNGVTRLLGIRSLTYDDLRDSGIDISKITKIDYGAKPEMNQEGKDIKVETHKMLVALFGENYGDELAKITAFTGKDGKAVPGVYTLDVSEKRLQVIYGKVKEIFEKNPPKEDKDKIIRDELFKKLVLAKKEIGERAYEKILTNRKVTDIEILTNQEIEDVLDDCRAEYKKQKNSR